MDKNLCPVLPPEERADWHEKLVSIRGVAAPGLLIVLVLGSILGGVATPTEAAAVGCFGTLAYAVGARRFGARLLRETCMDTIKVGAMCMWIVVGAQTFSAVFAGVGGNQLVAQWLTQLPFGAWGALVFSLVVVFFLGMFIETIAIIMLAVPVLAPVMVSLGFDPLWYGIVFNVVLQTAFLSPPFGIALFYLKSVSPPDVPLLEIYKASVPFLCLQWLCVALFLAFPQLVVWLPHKLFS
jgi:tripartite ATP-independent transporter DctM subunit